ncbi:acyl-ACP thioesterase [Limosilactobacillus sp. STM2_1]|uniref:Acyl-ACP thioesterase n=1 Tax=Limosilactobacillus rudii TaxID=2759755 RepID=A0A7W3YP61_9LACO|nr:acyl-ACP thioesterase domain-containing protein [Limosilactobacillus rudii]MBB1080389.1 acyl-ACP thioesterase [Limosilactobacillus rudii]MBB1098415.1 acyl-ACP thioesterase [Limosilactobacillus rudii]MCD7135423.1 thioesterase [Limosilactobacillus rudii]
MKLTQDAQTYEMPHLLAYYECDETGHPSMSMMLSMISMVSDEHSMSLGMGTNEVQQTGGTWVVSGYEGQLNKKQPLFGETIILGTRAVAYNRFFAVREFWIMDQNHKVEYAHFKSMFVFMNLKTRRMESIPPVLIKPFNSPMEKRIPRLKRPHKLAETSAVVEQNYRVRYFDLDANHHVNNARYFDWLLDPLGREFLRKHQIQSFSLQYLQEVRDGEIINSRVNQLKAEETTSYHQIVVGNQVDAIAEINWYKNNG